MSDEKINRLVAALAPLAECYLPPKGYEHHGVTAHFTTEQIKAAKAAMHYASIKDHGLSPDYPETRPLYEQEGC